MLVQIYQSQCYNEVRKYRSGIYVTRYLLGPTPIKLAGYCAYCIHTYIGMLHDHMHGIRLLNVTQHVGT